ncbi:hypothetical protein FGB62_221g00 [Gracilaria domingensis]|nr:hypothetical protein FGB62_221g00 [Gracilaria domingensis]
MGGARAHTLGISLPARAVPVLVNCGEWCVTGGSCAVQLVCVRCVRMGGARAHTIGIIWTARAVPGVVKEEDHVFEIGHCPCLPAEKVYFIM